MEVASKDGLWLNIREHLKISRAVQSGEHKVQKQRLDVEEKGFCLRWDARLLFSNTQFLWLSGILWFFNNSIHDIIIYINKMEFYYVNYVNQSYNQLFQICSLTFN